ncbi:hypothetical protein MSAN_00090800 [Mycena sanguinolenta]|uniref:Uncharacterized protein n=1 Tax=Mycena sanguinolenta TaxID=230812 RepID=A0A8H7DML5_9AGAR|nr:hypothetical protein MSAN_00090800 [Mycena sanguinolenta]
MRDPGPTHLPFTSVSICAAACIVPHLSPGFRPVPVLCTKWTDQPHRVVCAAGRMTSFTQLTGEGKPPKTSFTSTTFIPTGIPSGCSLPSCSPAVSTVGEPLPLRLSRPLCAAHTSRTLLAIIGDRSRPRLVTRDERRCIGYPERAWL